MKIINGNLINKEQNTSQKGMNFPFIENRMIDEYTTMSSGHDFFENTNLIGGSGKGAHDSINKLILQSTLSNMTRGIDDFKFGQDVEQIDYPKIFGGGSYGRHHGNQTNILESFIKSKSSDKNFEDLLNINISGRLGKDKNLDYNLSGSKGNIGLNLSKLF
jgi:hypothetical protein